MEIAPVRAHHPDDPAAPALLSPVYDTMSDSELRRFSSHSHNASAFVARPSSMPLEEFLRLAPERLQAAMEARAFVQDERASLYVYGIRYVPPSDIAETIPPAGRRAGYLLLGLVGALDLQRTPESSIAPHEHTFAERVDERVRLTEVTGMTFAPIMAGYTLPNHALNDLLEATLGLHRRSMSLEGTATPIVQATLDGTEHRIWRLDDEGLLSKIARILGPLRLLILDGHHRYAAARELLRRGQPGSAPLAMLVESRDRALQLLPWHRTLTSSAISFEELTTRAGARFASVEPLSEAPTLEVLLAELSRMSERHERGFLAVGPLGAWRFRGPPSAAGGYDFDLLHEYLGEEFHQDPHDFGLFRSPRLAVEAVKTPGSPWSGGVAFLLPRLRQEAIEEGAFATGRVLAHKSTMFLPKVAEGVLFASTRSDRTGLSPGRLPRA